MNSKDKNLLLSKGWNIVKLGGVERAVKVVNNVNRIENITRSFIESLNKEPIMVLTRSDLHGKTSEERDVLVLKLMNGEL